MQDHSIGHYRSPEGGGDARLPGGGHEQLLVEPAERGDLLVGGRLQRRRPRVPDVDHGPHDRAQLLVVPGFVADVWSAPNDPGTAPDVSLPIDPGDCSSAAVQRPPLDPKPLRQGTKVDVVVSRG
jgi:hypothetical protein